MADRGLRIRTERLLAGDVRTDDLVRLFLDLRDRCDNRQCFKEMGDFVAHRLERTKGIVTEEVRDWYAIASFLMPRFDRDVKPIYGDRLPLGLPDFLKATFRRADSSFFKHAKVRRPDASKTLSTAIDKLVINQDGTFAVSEKHTKEERNLVQALLQVLIVRPAFDDDRLFSDFTATLKNHGLLKKEELRRFDAVRPAIALFAVTIMHNCSIQLGDGKASRLSVSLNGYHIEVHAPVPVSFPNRRAEPLYFGSAMFGTQLRPLDYCKFELLRSDEVKSDLELATPEILLSPLA